MHHTIRAYQVAVKQMYGDLLQRPCSRYWLTEQVIAVEPRKCIAHLLSALGVLFDQLSIHCRFLIGSQSADPSIPIQCTKRKGHAIKRALFID